MASKFGDAQLEALNVDPARSLTAPCPFCGSDMVLGPRRDNGNVSIGHAAIDTPEGPICGCSPFRELVYTKPLEFLRLCKSHGVRWARIVG